ADNAWWMDVLEHGQASSHAGFFDIEWHPANSDLDGKVLVPMLGDHYGLVLERGEFRLVFEADGGSFAVRYYEHRLPIDPHEYPMLLTRAEQRLAGAGITQELRDEWASLATGFANLPARDEQDPARLAERARDAAVHKRRLARLAGAYPPLRRGIEAAVDAFNARSASARNAMHALLERQAYRVAYWRVASDEINYRRFFDINELAALRMEDAAVFEATHAFALGLAAAGRIDGLRIDHPDGLHDPGAYFERVQAEYARLANVALAAPAPAPAPATEARPPRPLYLLIEKIAAGYERVPQWWAIHGSTGYRFAALVNGVFVDTGAKRRIDRIWRAFTGERADFESMAYECKLLIMRNALASELTVLTSELSRIARADRRTRDYTFNNLRRALAEVAACMPVYRTYLTDRASPQDRRFIQWAVGRAVRHSTAADTTIFGFIGESLLGRARAGAQPALRRRVRAFARRFQQLTAPVTAKGVEDTALYRFNRLVSLNEVGSEPEVFGFSVKAFHAASADRAASWPHTMIATSTHDNKRSEDVRARIDVLSETPAAWRLALRRWRTMNRSRRRTIGGQPAPAANDEYLLYQVLLGTFRPEDAAGEALQAYTERIVGYMTKAAREAKLRTSWINPDPAYEQALDGFVRALLGPGHSNPFLADLQEQAGSIAWFGALNSLSMVAIKYASPGMPDLYQGNECFDFSLVDPDNRRPVDFAHRSALLEALERRAQAQGLHACAAELARAPMSDAAKLFVTWRLLQLRREHEALLRDGDYLPLEAHGLGAGHALAFARRLGDQVLVLVAARLFVGLLGRAGALPAGHAAWGDTHLTLDGIVPAGPLVDMLSQRSHEPRAGVIDVGELLADGLPAAVLVGSLRP
ncbi:MAG: malto-oligosyltrehalose synthase, partial [Burkholderiales bacterium]